MFFDNIVFVAITQSLQLFVAKYHLCQSCMNTSHGSLLQYDLLIIFARHTNFMWLLSVDIMVMCMIITSSLEIYWVNLCHLLQCCVYLSYSYSYILAHTFLGKVAACALYLIYCLLHWPIYYYGPCIIWYSGFF